MASWGQVGPGKSEASMTSYVQRTQSLSSSKEADRIKDKMLSNVRLQVLFCV